jgi:hypothetical protein
MENIYLFKQKKLPYSNGKMFILPKLEQGKILPIQLGADSAPVMDITMSL